jgi:hypothetical protein
MKALIATGVGVLALGGLLVANSGRSASAQSSLAGPAIVSQAEQSRTTLVNCGEGRQALVYTDPRTGQAQVQCVGADNAFLTGAMTTGMTPGVATAMPVSQFAPAIVSPARPAVQQQVEYREPAAPVYRSTARRSSASASRTSSSTYGRSAEPVYSRTSEAPASQTRSWKKSAIIIGGSTAAGAGVGAVLDGKDGAKKGAVVGLLGGTIYDIATRTRH